MDASAPAARTGYFGKVPSQGDFVSNGLPRALADMFDLWLREAVRDSQRKLGRGRQEAFLVAPIWRMALEAGVAGPDPVIGVMMPSVDRVGRYFPLVIAAPLARRALSVDDMTRLTPWFDAASALALSTLRPDFALARFDEEAAGMSIPDSMLPPARGGGGGGGGSSLWWAETDAKDGKLFEGMPAAEAFDAHFLPIRPGDAGAAAEPARPAGPRRDGLLTTETGRASLKGAASAGLKEMTLVAAGGQVMSVISGIGRYPASHVAAQVVADTLTRIESPFSMNDLIAEAKGKLGTANTLLRARGAPTGEVFAASIVTLLAQASRYSLLWAGNARAYLYRDGVLTQMTRDHTEARLPHILTRAVGGAAQLALDSATGQINERDQFLLCSGGLALMLEDIDLIDMLSNAASPQEAADRLTQEALIAGASLDVSALVVKVSARTLVTHNETGL
ncbi:MAG: type VI secretion system-associated protein TagF [Pikeienuella sp.]